MHFPSANLNNPQFTLAMGSRVRKSPYFESTVDAGVTHFTVYNHMYMPTSYGDIWAEYKRLTEGVSLWDVAVERQVELNGPDALKLAQYITPRKLTNFSVGQGKYVPVCDHDGNIINDPILIKISETRFWLSIADSDIVYFAKAIAAEKNWDVSVFEPDVSPLAVQGPKAEQLMVEMLGEHIKDIKYFWYLDEQLDGIPFKIMRSGWSKQGGFELFLEDSSKGNELWQMIYEAGKKYDIGPGAPNYIERIESGLLSFAADTLTDSDPWEVGLGAYVHLDREDDFAGKKALMKKAEDKTRKLRSLVSLTLDGAALLPNSEPWRAYNEDGEDVGKVSAVAYSPRLQKNIAVALINKQYAGPGQILKVLSEKFQGQRFPYQATVTTLPFKAA